MSDRGDENRPMDPDDDDPDAPPSEEEVAASKRLRDALAKGDASHEGVSLATSLRAAWSPDSIDEGLHAEMLDDLPLTDEELVLAAELRDALGTNDVVVALRSAWSPTSLSEAEHRAIIARALGIGGGKTAKVISIGAARSRNVTIITTTSVLALAASVIVWISTAQQSHNGGGTEAPLAKARSTQPLFDEPFKAGENTSARIDKIAMARASDYRDNRFAKWGVR